MRKTISILVLICLTVHGLSRLGVISYLYANRHDLAYSLGITPEKAIALCKGDYFQDAGLSQQKENFQLPDGLAQAQEIILGFPPVMILNPAPSLNIIVARDFAGYNFKKCCPPSSELFHPPLS